jgi:hypothetical protein
MTTAFKPIKGRAYTFNVGLVSQANTKVLLAAPTITSGDFQISKDNGAFANLATLPTVTPTGGRSVQISLSATEMTADNVVIVGTSAGSSWCDVFIDMETKDPSIAFQQFMMLDTSGNPQTGIAGTITIQRVLDNGTFASPTSTTVTEIGNGLYWCALSISDMAFTGSMTLRATSATSRPTLITFNNAY